MKINTQEDLSLRQEMKVALATASMGARGKARNVMLIESDLPSLVPSQSLLKVRSAKFTDLKMGDIILVRVGSSFRVRRFVKTKITRSHTLLLVAHENGDKKEPIPQNALLGKVEAVQNGGRTFDPAKEESFLQLLWGKLTEFGTHRPFGIFSAK